MQFKIGDVQSMQLTNCIGYPSFLSLLISSTTLSTGCSGRKIEQRNISFITVTKYDLNK